MAAPHLHRFAHGKIQLQTGSPHAATRAANPSSNAAAPCRFARKMSGFPARTDKLSLDIPLVGCAGYSLPRGAVSFPRRGLAAHNLFIPTGVKSLGERQRNIAANH